MSLSINLTACISGIVWGAWAFFSLMPSGLGSIISVLFIHGALGDRHKRTRPVSSAHSRKYDPDPDKSAFRVD